ncbi:hypothetical protein ACFY1P_34105 [Streptomyces sp. NPDC001407]|uniref:hypothetical protein n=1 Tax=Streptomyces sp. NPDC001407 TaxID=3364573 RepID=UPI00367809AA
MRSLLLQQFLQPPGQAQELPDLMAPVLDQQGTLVRLQLGSAPSRTASGSPS